MTLVHWLWPFFSVFVLYIHSVVLNLMGALLALCTMVARVFPLHNSYVFQCCPIHPVEQLHVSSSTHSPPFRQLPVQMAGLKEHKRERQV